MRACVLFPTPTTPHASSWDLASSWRLLNSGALPGPREDKTVAGDDEDTDSASLTLYFSGEAWGSGIGNRHLYFHPLQPTACIALLGGETTRLACCPYPHLSPREMTTTSTSSEVSRHYLFPLVAIKWPVGPLLVFVYLAILSLLFLASSETG